MSQISNFNKDVSHQLIKTFHQLNISNADFLRTLDKLNFQHPTPIQILSIPAGIQDKNIIAQAKAGTGKTLAFSSIFIERLIKNNDQIHADSDPQVLILLPTRELAIQVFEFIEQLLSTLRSINPNLLPHVKSGIFIGGLPLQDDRRNLKIQHVKIVVGTIGRIVALMKENSLVLSSVHTFILDEADKLMGQKDFYKHITYIFDILQKQSLNNLINSQKEDNSASENVEQGMTDEKETAFETQQRRKKNMKSKIQYLAYSATYPEDLKAKLEKLMENSVFIDAINLQNLNGEEQISNQKESNIQKGERDLNLENIVQYRIDIKQHQTLSITKQKVNSIIDILKKVTFNQAIIFYNDKIKGENLHSELKAQNYSVIFIHGDQTQADRIKIMNQIRRNKTQIIISTDLLSRGIDIATIDLVVNYDMPSSVETYYHRVGRTGRYGRFGVSVLLVQQNEEAFIEQNIVHFCRLQDFPLDCSEINTKLQQKSNETQIQLNTNQQNEGKQTGGVSAKQKGKDKPAPQKYHHEFTQGIIREEVDINEKFYDESNFKYFEESSLSPVILDGEAELSGSMFSDEDQLDDQEGDDDDNDIEGSNNDTYSENKGDIQQKKKMNHECNDQSEWGFLSCEICYEFLVESQKHLNREFKLLQYFKVKSNKQ